MKIEYPKTYKYFMVSARILKVVPFINSGVVENHFIPFTI